MHHRISICLLSVLIALAAASCTRDPQKLKLQYLSEGDAYQKEGKTAEAIISYRNAVAQDPNFAEARTKLAAAYVTVGDRVGALRESVRAADLLPDDMAAQLTAGKLLLEYGQFEDARSRASKVLAKDPKNVDGLVLLGNSLVGLKDLDGAIGQIEEAIAADPHRTLSYTNLGILQAAQGSREAAESTLKRAIEIEPNSPYAHLSLGNFYWALGRMDEAENELKTAVSLDPKSPEANRGLATLYASTGHPKEAEPFLKVYADSSTDVGPKLVLADYYLSAGRTAESTDLLNLIANDEKGFAPAKLRLATIDFQAGRFDQAFQTVDAVLQRDPKSEDARLVKSRFLINHDRPAEAVPIAASVISDNPQSIGGHFLHASALEATQDVDGALKEYKTVLQLNPSYASALLRLADLYMRRGEARTAAEFLGQVTQDHPNSFVARLLLAQSLIALGDLTRAESELKALAAAQPNSAQVQALLGELYWERRDFSAARTAYAKTVELQPGSFQGVTGLVKTDIVQKRPEAALARVEQRLAAHPNDEATQMLAGSAFTVLGDFKRAEAAYKRVLALDSSNMEAYGRLGSLYMGQSRLDEAKAEFEKAAVQEPDSVIAAKTMVGIILSMQGRHEEARQQYERVLAIDPRAAVASNNLAWYYAEGNENLDKALEFAQTAKVKLPKNPQVNDTLGWIYYKKGLASMAVGPLSDGVAATPNNPIIRYHLGMAQLQNQQAREARSNLERALALNPEFSGADDARKALASIRQ
jgi:tetratricopeptide (TPR) repeat protein